LLRRWICDGCVCIGGVGMGGRRGGMIGFLCMVKGGECVLSKVQAGRGGREGEEGSCSSFMFNFMQIAMHITSLTHIHTQENAPRHIGQETSQINKDIFLFIYSFIHPSCYLRDMQE
jgi:hypothetical protein